MIPRIEFQLEKVGMLKIFNLWKRIKNIIKK